MWLHGLPLEGLNQKDVENHQPVGPFRTTHMFEVPLETNLCPQAIQNVVSDPVCTRPITRGLCPSLLPYLGAEGA